MGQMAQLRFWPNAFEVDGSAVDMKGEPCRNMACPHCHLQIPRVFLELNPFFVSIVGAPSTGKSYFLASMIWRLKKILPSYFSYVFTEVDAEMNSRLNKDYVEQQFDNSDADACVKIDKTEVSLSDPYDSVLIDGQDYMFPKPFIFSFCPSETHKYSNRAEQISLAITFYDNAGESYLPANRDKASFPVTKHLGISDCIFFLFDPIQDSRFRSICKNYSNDPQLRDEFKNNFRWTPLRQETILGEMINRIRVTRDIGANEKTNIPIFVIVTKYDAWKDMLPNRLHRCPWARVGDDKDHSFLIKKQVEEASVSVRRLFQENIPEIVGVVEKLSTNVTYIPVSATGGPPEQDPKTGIFGFRSRNIKPFWAEVPLLYALANNRRGMISMISNK